MEQLINIPKIDFHQILQLNQGLFFSLTDEGERVPVNTVKNFEVKDEQTLLFYNHHFPVTEKAWNVFAAELYLFKKGIDFSMNLQGIGIIADSELGFVEFHIHAVEYFEHPHVEKRGLFSSFLHPYFYIFKKSADLLRGSAPQKKIAI